jgi:hypothetical protein
VSAISPAGGSDLIDANPEGFWRLVRFEAENEADRLDYYAELKKIERKRKTKERKRLRLLAPPVSTGRLTLADAVGRLQGVRRAGEGRWSARCPIHEDRSPSLLIEEHRERPGEPFVLCRAGCDFRSILEALR